MMKITRIKNSLSVVLSTGELLTTNNCTDEMFDTIMDYQHDDRVVKNIMKPKYILLKEQIANKLDMLNNFDKSDFLTVKGDSVYVPSISELSLPEDLAFAMWNAERNNDQELLNSYMNFWTLACLNQDPAARANLFWFLNQYGMSISSSGLFVAYRNVVLHNDGENNMSADMVKAISEAYTDVKFVQKKNPEDYHLCSNEEGGDYYFADARTANNAPYYVGTLAYLYASLADEETGVVYTDGYTGKFRIKIGEPVTMDRDMCDANQNNTCSRGLHVAGKSWLQSNYFGDTGLRVLVNPADVVAVPPQDSYGKMRVCAYVPVAVVGFDDEGSIVDEALPDGFEDDFINDISYTGEVSTREVQAYKIVPPAQMPDDSRERIYSNIEKIKLLLELKNGTRVNQ
jgi:hypothetical protein